MAKSTFPAVLQGIKLELKSPGESPLIAQPPNDKHLGNASMFHYTWGVIVEDSSKNKRWGFDKREYIASDLEHKVAFLSDLPLQLYCMYRLEYCQAQWPS